MFVECGGIGDFNNGGHFRGDDRRHEQEDGTRCYGPDDSDDSDKMNRNGILSHMGWSLSVVF